MKKLIFIVELMCIFISQEVMGQIFPPLRPMDYSSVTEYQNRGTNATSSTPSLVQDNSNKTIIRNYKDSLEVLYEYIYKGNRNVVSGFYLNKYNDTNAVYFQIDSIVYGLNEVHLQDSCIEVNDVQVVGDFCYFCGTKYLYNHLQNGAGYDLESKGMVGRFNIKDVYNGVNKCEIVESQYSKSLSRMSVHLNERKDSIVVDMIGELKNTANKTVLIKMVTDTLTSMRSTNWNEYFEYINDNNEVLTDVLATTDLLITSSYLNDNKDSILVRYKKLNYPFFDMSEWLPNQSTCGVGRYSLHDIDCNNSWLHVSEQSEVPIMLKHIEYDDYVMAIACECNSVSNGSINQGVIVCGMNFININETHYLKEYLGCKLHGLTYLPAYDMASVLVEGRIDSSYTSDSYQLRYVHMGEGDSCTTRGDTVYYLTEKLQSIDTYKNKRVIVSGLKDCIKPIVGNHPRYWVLDDKGCFQVDYGQQEVMRTVTPSYQGGKWVKASALKGNYSDIKQLPRKIIKIKKVCYDNGIRFIK